MARNRVIGGLQAPMPPFRYVLGYVGLLVVVATLTACSPPAQMDQPTASPALPPTPMPESDEHAIELLLIAEGEGVVAKDLDRIMALWADECYVVDARHTPEDSSDDLVWRGRYAVRDRYITVVFPGNPAFVQPADLVIRITGDTAVVTATTQIGSEISPAGDRWTFVRTPAGWRIQSLTYNLEPRSPS